MRQEKVLGNTTIKQHSNKLGIISARTHLVIVEIKSFHSDSAKHCESINHKARTVEVFFRIKNGGGL